MNGIQEVSGSIPLISTTLRSQFLEKTPEIERFQAFFFVFEFLSRDGVRNLCGMGKKRMEGSEEDARPLAVVQLWELVRLKMVWTPSLIPVKPGVFYRDILMQSKKAAATGSWTCWT